ncbi:MAG: hypothetical protein HZA51_09405 [Planctomycetes bacterium]|nr:hypothetical protein [Planctomycetota bacterium]
MFAQILFILFLHLAGGIIAARATPHGSRWLAWWPGLLWGLLLWVVWGLLLLCVKLPYSAWSMFGGLGIAAIVVLRQLQRARSLSRRDGIEFLASTVLVAIVAAMASRFDYSALSYDSFTQIILGRQLAQFGGFDPACHPALASWGVFVPIAQSASLMIGVDFLYALWPTMAAVFAITFFGICATGLRTLNVGTAMARMMSTIATLFFVSTYFVLFQSFYVHNNLPSAMYLFLAVSCMWLGTTRSERGWFIPGMAAFFGFILLRTESPLYFALFAAPLLWTETISRRTKLLCIVTVSALTVVWYLRLIALIGGGTDILSPTKAWGLMGIIAVFAATSMIPDRPIVRRCMAGLPWLMMFGATALVVGVTVKRPEHMARCMETMGQNIFSDGRWGASWAILLVLIAVAFGLPRFHRQDWWTVGAGVYLAVVYGLGVFREQPYRIGWGDSANRLLTTVVPILLGYVTLRFGAAAAIVTSTPNPARSGRSMALGLGVLFVFLAAVGVNKPVDRARGATVVAQPACPDGHGVDIALRGIVDKEYTAASEPGPATVVFDLGRSLRADRLEMIDYAESEALTDFAWWVSSDQKNWYQIYDTKDRAPDARLTITPLCSRFRMTSAPEFRYVKLDFRGSRGQNRLLLRSVRIYSTPWNNWMRRLEPLVGKPPPR